MAASLLVAVVSAEDAALRWPAFLPPRQAFPADLEAAIERTWTEFTFSRTVRGRTTGVPFELYAALVDAPDVTAAAARYRQVARHEVRLVGENLYEADDGDGAHGSYRVLVHEAHRRVIYSWGEHSGGLLGTIRGDSLTVLALEPRDEAIEQTLTAYVRIGNWFAAALARVLVALFGGIADRKLTEGFAVAARVAEWAVAEPEAFCAWLAASGLPVERRLLVQSQFAGCR